MDYIKKDHLNQDIKKEDDKKQKNDLPDQIIPKSMIKFEPVTMVSFDVKNETSTEFASHKIEPKPMVTFDSIDESRIASKPLISIPLVRFDDGFDPTITDSITSNEKNINLKDQLSKTKLQNPEVTKEEDFSIVSDNHKKMIKRQQEILQIRGKAIQKAELVFNGTDFYIENGIIFNKSGEKICNFVLCVISETIYHFKSRNGFDVRSKYKLNVITMNKSFEVSIWGDEVYDFKWIRRATGGKATIYARGRRDSLFNELLSDLLNKENYDVYDYYDTNGWHKLPIIGYRYLHDKGVVGLTDSKISAASNHKLIYDQNLVGSKAVFLDVIRMMLNVCNTSAISIVLVLYAHLGVLTTLFDLADFPIKFIVALIGVTNARKTSLALNLTKLFDRSVAPKPDISFEATVGGIETSFSSYHDAVFVIDDLKPSNSKEKQKEASKKLEKIVRAYGDRVSTVRMNDFSTSGKDVYYPIWGCCMITGEYLDGVASTLARIVNISLDANDVNNKELRYFQENYKILSTHMVDFISYITDNFEKVVSYIRTRAIEIRSEVENVFDIPRYKESYSTFLVCSEIFINYALDRGFFSNQEAQTYLYLFKDAIHTIIASSDSSIVEHNPGIVALHAIDNYITSGFIKIYSEGESPARNNEIYAYIEDDYLCIRLEDTYRILIKYLKSLNSEPSVTTPKQLIPFFEALDVIRVVINDDRKKRRTHKLKGRTSECRFLFIKKKKMAEILRNENLY